MHGRPRCCCCCCVLVLAGALLAAGSAPAPSHPLLQSKPLLTRKQAEKELAAARAALSATTAERDSLREDLWEVKVAKRRADQGFKAQLERAGALDKELAFYQSQSARVMADRDRAVWEGEELRAANLQVGAGCWRGGSGWVGCAERGEECEGLGTDVSAG